MRSRRAASLRLRPHCSKIRWMCSQRVRATRSGVSGTGGSAGPPAEQGVGQLGLAQWPREVVVGAGAQRQDRAGEAVVVGDGDDPGRGGQQLAEPPDRLEAVAAELAPAGPQRDDGVGEPRPDGGVQRGLRAVDAGHGEPPGGQGPPEAGAGGRLGLDQQEGAL